MATDILVPTLGESVSEATIGRWFKKPGDTVAADEMLCELETDKVTVEVPSPASGTLGEIVAAEGTTVGPNALLATLAEGAGAAPPRPPVSPVRKCVSRRRAIAGDSGGWPRTIFCSSSTSTSKRSSLSR